MLKLKVTTVGTSSGIVLPKEALARLNVERGDHVYLVETEDGYRVTPYDPEFEKQMKLAEEGMQRNRNALRELAK